MKKLLSLLLISALILLTATSCLKKNELNEVAIVQAIGIDTSTEGFKLTLQIYSPKGAGSSTAIDTSKNNSTSITAEGETIAAAIKNATLLQGKVIFTGHNRIIVLGRELCLSGIEGIFSYFNRSTLTRQNVQMLMSQTTAEDIVTQNLEQGILAAETIENMLQNSDENGLSYQCLYYELAKNMSTMEGTGAIPTIKKPEPPSAEKSGSDGENIQNVNKLTISDTAIFKDYKLVDTVNSGYTRGLLLLENKLSESGVVCSTEDFGKVSINLYDCKTRLSTADDLGGFTLSGTLYGRLDEVMRGTAVSLNTADIEALERSCEDIISAEITDSFNKIIKGDKSDILHLSDLILKKDANLWKEFKQNPDDNFAKMKINTDIKIKIIRVGLETDEKF